MYRHARYWWGEWGRVVGVPGAWLVLQELRQVASASLWTINRLTETEKLRFLVPGKFYSSGLVCGSPRIMFNVWESSSEDPSIHVLSRVIKCLLFCQLVNIMHCIDVLQKICIQQFVLGSMVVLTCRLIQSRFLLCFIFVADVNFALRFFVWSTLRLFMWSTSRLFIWSTTLRLIRSQ